MELLPTPSPPVTDKLHIPNESPDVASEQTLLKRRAALIRREAGQFPTVS